MDIRPGAKSLQILDRQIRMTSHLGVKTLVFFPEPSVRRSNDRIANILN